MASEQQQWGLEELGVPPWRRPDGHRHGIVLKQCAENEPNGCGDHRKAEQAIHIGRLACVFTGVRHTVPPSLGAADVPLSST